MKRLLVVLLATIGIPAFASGVFIGGEIVPFNFGHALYGIPCLTFGGVYPLDILGREGNVHRVELTLTGATNNPLAISALYGISFAGAYYATPKVFAVGAGIGMWGMFQNFALVDGFWSIFLESRFVWNNFLAVIVRLHLPYMIDPAIPYLGMWGSVGFQMRIW